MRMSKGTRTDDVALHHRAADLLLQRGEDACHRAPKVQECGDDAQLASALGLCMMDWHLRYNISELSHLEVGDDLRHPRCHKDQVVYLVGCFDLRRAHLACHQQGTYHRCQPPPSYR